MKALIPLWRNRSRTTGKIFFAGNFGPFRILILPNGFKEEGTNQPDYQLFVIWRGWRR